MDEMIFQPDWGDVDGTAFDDMLLTLTEVGLSVPFVPAWAEASLRRSDFGWAWGTDARISPWAVYSLVGDLFPSPLPGLLEADQPDFWMFGHRGYGINSCGAGLLVRQGPLLLIQQHLWGGGYMDNDWATAALNEATELWAGTASYLGAMPPSDLRVAVLFCGYRGMVELWVRDHAASQQLDHFAEVRVPGWRALWSLANNDEPRALFDLHLHEDEAVVIAAQHLTSLLAHEAGISDSNAKPSTAAAYSETGSTSSDLQAIQPSERVPRDEAEAVIGLNELVEAILQPHFEHGADWTYWGRLVELTCLVFGLDGRTQWLDVAIERIPSKVLPMQDSPEVPEEIGAGFAGIEDIYGRIDAVQEQMRQLQREFFRGVLLAIDPRIEERSTTVGRLRELGLPKRTYRNWDES